MKLVVYAKTRKSGASGPSERKPRGRPSPRFRVAGAVMVEEAVEDVVVEPVPADVLAEVLLVLETVTVLVGGTVTEPPKTVVLKSERMTTGVGALETVNGLPLRNGSMTVLYGKNSL